MVWLGRGRRCDLISEHAAKLTVRNFKRFGGLGNPVVFIGPNNSGKPSAMKTLALRDIGLKRWNEKRGGRRTPEKRPGVTVNRRDLVSIPVPDANLLWRNLRCATCAP